MHRMTMTMLTLRQHIRQTSLTCAIRFRIEMPVLHRHSLILTRNKAELEGEKKIKRENRRLLISHLNPIKELKSHFTFSSLLDCVTTVMIEEANHNQVAPKSPYIIKFHLCVRLSQAVCNFFKNVHLTSVMFSQTWCLSYLNLYHAMTSFGVLQSFRLFYV